MFSRRPFRRPAADPRGQVLVIVAAGLITMIAMIGLVVDGGYAWGQQRDNQNAADAASEAGAVVLAEILTGASRTDTDVDNAVDASLAANGVSRVGAWYTNIEGHLINNNGTPVGSTGGAADVGGGVLPPNAAGVQAATAKTFNTFLVRIIGFSTLTTEADATAVAGYLTGVCSGGDCAVLPVAVPNNALTCTENGATPVNPVGEWPYYNIPVTIPLCRNNPGNVGWMDWTPPWGGTSELITAIGPPTTNPQLSVPSWVYMTSTGNINSQGVEDALNWYIESQNNVPILIPMFDSTCNTEPNPPSPGVSDVERCPPENVGGEGQNQWYHIARFVAFRLTAIYLAGSNLAECEENGNGATSCIKGSFVRLVTSGTVGPGLGYGGGDPNSAVGVQLIK